MAKTDYIIISEPNIVKISSDNPEKAEAKYRIDNPRAKNILVVPRKAAHLNGKIIKPN